MINNKVIYQHRRNDTGEVFYVGLGSIKRPYTKKSRNKYWHNIVNKCGYTIEVLIINLSKDEVIKLEVGLIEYYGIDNLCNMTTGGECTTFTKEVRENMSKSRPSTLTILHRKSISDSLIGKHQKGKSVIDINTNKEYDSLTKACLDLKLSFYAVNSQLVGYRKRQNYNTLYYI